MQEQLSRNAVTKQSSTDWFLSGRLLRFARNDGNYLINQRVFSVATARVYIDSCNYLTGADCGDRLSCYLVQGYSTCHGMQISIPTWSVVAWIQSVAGSPMDGMRIWIPIFFSMTGCARRAIRMHPERRLNIYRIHRPSWASGTRCRWSLKALGASVWPKVEKGPQVTVTCEDYEQTRSQLRTVITGAVALHTAVCRSSSGKAVAPCTPRWQID